MFAKTTKILVPRELMAEQRTKAWTYYQEHRYKTALNYIGGLLWLEDDNIKLLKARCLLGLKKTRLAQMVLLGLQDSDTLVSQEKLMVINLLTHCSQLLKQPIQVNFSPPQQTATQILSIIRQALELEQSRFYRLSFLKYFELLNWQTEPLALVGMGRCLFQLGEVRMALNWHCHMEAWETNKHILLGLGHILTETYRNREALATYEHALQLFPEDKSILLALARAYAHMKYFNAAYLTYGRLDCDSDRAIAAEMENCYLQGMNQHRRLSDNDYLAPYDATAWLQDYLSPEEVQECVAEHRFALFGSRVHALKATQVEGDKDLIITQAP